MKIRVEPPAPELRRERVEKKLFAQLAAVEMADRVDAVLPKPSPRRMPYVLGAAALAAAVVAIILFAQRGSQVPPQVATEEPSRVVTPIGGESRFIVGDAVIDAKSDTSVEVRHGDGGAITLVLSRGAVDCDVEPRHGRPPFRVLAGDATVEVVGTRFTVTRTPSLRVDVARGKVKVTTPASTNLVEAGESWPVVTAAVPTPAPVADPTPQEVTPPAPVVVKAKAKDLSQQSYREALRLETTDPKKAAQLYRTIATESKSLAAVALVSLAQVELEQLHDPAAALAATDEHAKRFPGAATAEDASWLRYQALVALGKRDEARGAAAEYLRQFPHGAYADRLQK